MFMVDKRDSSAREQFSKTKKLIIVQFEFKFLKV